MKTLIVILLLGAGVAIGGAFFGLYTIPGLENMPTVDSMGEERDAAREERAKELQEGGRPPQGPFKTSEDSAARKRAEQLRTGQRQIVPGS